ncbi:MAG: hypothetical protein JSU92_04800, partial [Deltaproteobacteria bacterium]
MIYGDVDTQALGPLSNVYPTAYDAAIIRAIKTGVITDSSRGSLWDTGLFGDVNGDNVVNVIDAMLITRYTAFLESTFANSPTTLVPVSVTVY